MLGLSWDSIDWETGAIRVNQQLLRDCEQKLYYLGLPKRGKRRVVYVAEDVMDWLREQKTIQEKQREAVGSVWNNEHNLVFTNELGRYLIPGTVYRNYKNVVEKLGLGDQRVHDLRHAYATNSLANGDDPESVKENLGHYSIKMLDRYGHRKSSAAAAGAARMGSYIRTVMPHDSGGSLKGKIKGNHKTKK